MKSTTRYTLIAISFVVFLVIAPLLIFYVSGRQVNLGGESNGPTGILDAKTNPSGADLFLDGTEHSSTPSIARFLKQGEYVVTLSKEGYYDWTKRLPIEASKVTYAQEGVTEIQLIKKSEPQILVPEGVSSFAIVKDVLWYTRGSVLYRAPINDLSKSTSITLDFKPATLELLRDRNHLFLGNGNVINTDTYIITKLPLMVSVPNAQNKIAVTGNGMFIFTDGKYLYSLDPNTKGTTRLLNQSVSGFTMVGSTGYFIEHTSPLKGRITSAIWDGTAFHDFQPLIPDTNLSPDADNELYITDNKELFCLCPKFYRVGQTLDQVATDAVNVRLDMQTNELSYRTAGNELWFYNFLTSQPQIVTRGNLDADTNFIVRSSIGYAFLGNALGLQAIELDNRDRQNRYQLLTGKQVWKIGFTDNQKSVIALQDGALMLVDIRN